MFKIIPEYPRSKMFNVKINLFSFLIVNNLISDIKRKAFKFHSDFVIMSNRPKVWGNSKPSFKNKSFSIPYR